MSFRNRDAWTPEIARTSGGGHGIALDDVKWSHIREAPML